MSSILRTKKIALVDCNSFYVSCERLFNPKIRRKPVVVLSNNDGCIISRSNEAKALGIKMGEPYFKGKDIIIKNKVEVFSSNYSLYGDLSRRVMRTLKRFNSDIEVYSIDEAFIELTNMNVDYESYVRQMRKVILQYTGIPVSIGIASTKTLTKVANHIAKDDESLEGVCSLVKHDNLDQVLEDTNVTDVWGVGRQLSKKLIANGIFNAKLLKNCEDAWVRKMMSVNGLKTVSELREISCLDLEETSATRKSCCTTRSFGKPLVNLDDIEQAVTTFARRATERIRGENLTASTVSVFLRTNPFDRNRYYSNSSTTTLSYPTYDTVQIVKTALQLTKIIFRENYKYKKAGVLLSGFYEKGTETKDLFSEARYRSPKLMSAVDQINERYGSDTIQIATECQVGKWKQKRKNCTQSYTTQLDNVLLI